MGHVDYSYVDLVGGDLHLSVVGDDCKGVVVEGVIDAQEGDFEYTITGELSTCYN